MSSSIEYKIYCLTERSVIRGYTTGLLTPVCPHDHNHIVIATTLVKISERLEGNLSNEVRNYHLETTGFGSTGLDISLGKTGQLTAIGYDGNNSLIGDLLDGFIITPSSPSQHFLDHRLTNKNITIPTSVTIPSDSITTIKYTNKNDLPKTFQFFARFKV